MANLLYCICTELRFRWFPRYHSFMYCYATLSLLQNSFFDHIMKQTGAKVHLRGRGSGYLEPTSGRESFETLYIYLQHGTQEGLQKAVKLCEDLVKHVKEDYEKLKCQPTSFYQPSSSSLPYHTGKNVL